MSWIQSHQPALVLAPMDGVYDAPMRELLTRHGAYDYCVSEFLRVTDEIPAGKAFQRDVPELLSVSNTAATVGPTTPSGIPVQIQILGGDPDHMAAAAQAAVIHGARAIDLNFGCPAPMINRHDGGASVLKDPDRIRAIVAAVRNTLPAEVPVSAKLRLGWEDRESIFENAERAAEGGASWLTIHGRTRMQGYSGTADWTLIGQVQKHLGQKLPIIANGDIRSLEDFQRCQEVTRCHHFMIGRGALGDPWLPRRIRAWMKDQALLQETPPLSFFVRDFIPLAETYSAGDEYTLRRLKQWIAIAQRVGGGTLFTDNNRDWLRLKRARTLSELKEALVARG